MKNLRLDIISFESQFPKEGEQILLFSFGYSEEPNLEIFETLMIDSFVSNSIKYNKYTDLETFEYTHWSYLKPQQN